MQMPAKIDPYWKERVWELTGSKNLSPEEIADVLDAEARSLGRDDSPKERWIAGAQADYRRQNDQSQLGYQDLRWPDGFLSHALPWEAAPVIFELLRESKVRPTIDFGRWFWRASLAAPGASFKSRREMAQTLMAWE